MGFFDDPVGATSGALSDVGGSVADVWHGVSKPFVDNPWGRMAVNYATGGMSSPLYAAYDYSRGKNIGGLQLAGAISGANSAYNAYNAADAASNAANYSSDFQGDYSGASTGGLDPSMVSNASNVSDAANYASDFQGDYSGYTNPGDSLGGNYMGGNDLQQNITQAGMQGYGGSDLTGLSDYEGPSSQGLSYGSLGGLKDLWTKYGKFAGPMTKMGAGLYDMYAKRRMAADMRQQAGDIEGRLASYYAPNSPEAQLMRQRMERLDAASGRNSQYGVRETNLAAQLAKERMGAYGQALPSLTSLYGGASALGSSAEAGLWRGAGDLLSNKDFMSSLGSLF